MNRDEAICRIRAALKTRSGKLWSVTGGREVSARLAHVLGSKARSEAGRHWLSHTRRQ